MEPQGAGRLIPGQKSVCLVFSAVGGEPLLAERDSHGRALLPSSSTLSTLPTLSSLSTLPKLPTLPTWPTLLSPGRHIVQLAPAGGARHPQGPDFFPETVAESIIRTSPPLSQPISRVLIVSILLGRFHKAIFSRISDDFRANLILILLWDAVKKFCGRQCPISCTFV